jgi:predicted permease
MSLLSALTTAVLPILAITAAGYVMGSRWTIDPEPLNTVTLQLLLPALAFHSFATSTLSGSATSQVVIGVVLFVGIMIVIAEGVGRLLGTSEPFLSALVLASVFPNSGNFGIPLSEFAFGLTGRTTAVLFVTVQNVLVYTVGAYIASRGQGQTGIESATKVVKLPLVYAAAAALIARWAGVIPPAGSSVMTTLALVGNASIPLMLIILGLQLAKIDMTAGTRVMTPTVLKLGAAPLVGIGIVSLLGFRNETVARVFILECATPAAIIPLILTVAYTDRDTGPTQDLRLTAPEYISTTIFVTTVASIVVLTVLIVVLQSGMIV